MSPPAHHAPWTNARRRLSALALAGAAMAATPAVAQVADPTRTPPAQETPPPGPPPQPEPDVFEGRVVRKVVLQRPVPPGGDEPAGAARFGPLPPEVEGLARQQLRVIEGTPYVQASLSADVARLDRVGRFGQIETRVQVLDDGSLLLVYTMTPRPVVKSVQPVGNRLINDQDIGKEVEGLVGTPVDRYRLEQSCRRIEQLYRERGYYLAQVSVDDKELEASGVVILIVREGERLKVTDIRFEGNRAFSPRELKSAIKTREAGLLDKGIVDDEQLENDVAALVGYYKDRGYLDVRASRIIRPSPNGREAIVTFLVEEGPVYTLRNVMVHYPEFSRTYPTLEEARAGAKPGERILPLSTTEFVVYALGQFSPEQVLGLMDLKPGGVYSDDKLRVSVQALRDAFGKLGYSEAGVIRRELRDPERPEVDLLILVYQGLPSKVGEVIIKGNPITKDRVIRQKIPLKPGRPADTTLIEETKRRLTNTNLFAQPSLDNPQPIKVTLQEPDPLEPAFRDVLVEVTETNTGSFNMGAAVSSDAGVIGTFSITQKNFDITDTPDTLGAFLSGRAFRGAGQTFSISLQPGVNVENYSISLAEPSLYDSDYKGNASLYYRTRDYTEYDEKRAGTQLGIGRRFGTRWEGAMPLRIEAIDVTNIDPGRPQDDWDSEGNSTLTSVGLSLSRVSFDHPIRPSKGSRLEFSVDQAGALGGDYSFTALRAEHSVYLPVYEDFLGARTVVSFSTKVGYDPQGRDAVPVFERYYLGGQGFRGFDYRGVSPRGVAHDTGLPSNDPIGGTWMFFWGAEIRQPIFKDTVALVGFLDTGTVTFKPGFEDYRASVGFGVRLYIPGLSPAPLAFDFGFPILKQPGDAERVFSFSIDVPWGR